MPSNVEIKARVHNADKLISLARKLSGETGKVIIQEDTFFHCPNGRLKLREIKGDKSELIFYNRSDKSGPKLSDYTLTQVTNAEELKMTLQRAYGVVGVVKKKRLLFIVGQTRIHIDDVENLGTFMELEVVLKPNQKVDVGEETADVLMEKLDIQKSDLIMCSYMDMLKH